MRQKNCELLLFPSLKLSFGVVGVNGSGIGMIGRDWNLFKWL